MRKTFGKLSGYAGVKIRLLQYQHAGQQRDVISRWADQVTRGLGTQLPNGFFHYENNGLEIDVAHPPHEIMGHHRVVNIRTGGKPVYADSMRYTNKGCVTHHWSSWTRHGLRFERGQWIEQLATLSAQCSREHPMADPVKRYKADMGGGGRSIVRELSEELFWRLP